MRRRCRSREAWVARRAGTSSTATSRRERDETRRSRCAADGAPICALVDGIGPLGRRSAPVCGSVRTRRRTAMQLREIMTRDPVVLSPDTTLKDAASKMREIDSGAMPVDEHDRLVGMLTDRDITVRATADGRDPSATKVREVMTADVVLLLRRRRGAGRRQQDGAAPAPPAYRAQPRQASRRHRLARRPRGRHRRRAHAGKVTEKVSEPAQPKRH